MGDTRERKLAANRARGRLMVKFRDEYNRLYDEELAAVGLVRRRPVHTPGAWSAGSVVIDEEEEL